MVSPSKLRQAKNIILAGGVIAHPTEAVYGLACDPANIDALLRLLSLKHRSWDKGLILVAADISQLDPYVVISPEHEKKLVATWPGPVTWILPVKPGISPLLTGAHRSLAVRVSAHPVVQALCRECGHPLVSTSANVQSSPPARSALAVRRIFGQNLDLILHGSVDLNASPTEIRDARTDQIIRSS